ncbi:uncharacterized protein [Coffea arabica]|uniref:Ubiquitin-like protease family profile domain-containing protein n=1 Tax=Coffea arabica TaxID=13443 RepID=A0ABM4UVX4_COFAR
MNWKNMHWYLFVIDMKNETIHIYDSLPVKEFNFNRLYPVMHVRNMLHEALAYGLGKAYQKDISKFPCIRPQWCPRQPDGNDCGIYVMYFMKHVSEMEAEMVVSFVSDKERCSLALELFVHPSNLVREDNLGVLPCMK